MAKSTNVGIGAINQGSINKVYQQRQRLVCSCGQPINEQRLSLGYLTCLICGAKEASKRKFTVVPMPKSNYILVTDMSLLKGLNSSHKGGLT
jgi:ribosomal protein L37AE/L43A